MADAAKGSEVKKDVGVKDERDLQDQVEEAIGKGMLPPANQAALDAVFEKHRGGPRVVKPVEKPVEKKPEGK